MFTLSRYFPKDTLYLYSFPAGEESGFFNGVPPWVEELVAGRPLLCAGPDVNVIAFESVYNDHILGLLSEMGVNPLPASQVVVVPKEINSDVVGKERNDKMKAFLKSLNCKGNLVMAQPFTDDELKSSYRINPELSVWYNDKENLTDYVPAENLPAIHAHFDSGKEFNESPKEYPFPCVVKVSSSSAGDGVRICHNAEDLAKAKEAFLHLEGHVIVYEFIHSLRNLCMQFGIPADPTQPIEIIGFNEQVIGKCGEFLGGMVTPNFDRPELKDLFDLLTNTILPKIRAKGWYGVGGLDVLITESGKYYFIDPNCRMTATFVFVCQVRNKQIKKSLLGFTGLFKGTEADFREKILPIAKLGTPEQLLNIASLAYKNGEYRFNGALVFDENTPREKVARELIERGVESLTLTCVAS